MAIEKRTVNGIEVGYDTVTHSYCNLPEERPEEETAPPEPEKARRGRPKSEDDEDDG